MRKNNYKSYLKLKYCWTGCSISKMVYRCLYVLYRCRASLILNVGTKWGRWLSSCTGHFIPRKKSHLYPLNKLLVGPQSWFGCTVDEINLSALPRSKSRFLGYSACSIGTVTPRHRWKENAERDCKAVWQGDRILLALDRKTWQAVVNMVVSFWVLKRACECGGGCEPLDAIQGRELMD